MKTGNHNFAYLAVSNNKLIYELSEVDLIYTFPVLFLLAFAEESNYLFRHYQVENGLSDNMVTCCVQDKSGYIWIGTRDGLNRFDGYTFKVFRNDPDVPESLGNNWITHPGLRP